MVIGVAPATVQAQDPPRSNRDIIMTATDTDGREAPLRRGYYNGSKGSGVDKIYYKHNIDNLALFPAAMRSLVNFQETPNGTTRVYLLPIGILECEETFLGLYPKNDCKIDEDRRDKLRLIVDYREIEEMPTDDKTFGVVSMYCTKTGNDACPDWVNKTVEYPAEGPWPWASS